MAGGRTGLMGRPTPVSSSPRSKIASPARRTALLLHPCIINTLVSFCTMLYVASGGGGCGRATIRCLRRSPWKPLLHKAGRSRYVDQRLVYFYQMKNVCLSFVYVALCRANRVFFFAGAVVDVSKRCSISRGRPSFDSESKQILITCH